MDSTTAVDVQGDARRLQEDVRRALSSFRDRSFSTFNPSEPTLTTMTITASLNVTHVCRDSMAIALSLVDGDGPLSTADAKPTRKRKRTSAFFNQITLRHGTKSVKVFNNGSMHVTGCTSPMQFLDIASAVCTLMTNVAGIETCDGTDHVRVTRFEVQMINLNFGTGVQLFLQGIRDECVARGLVASYDADMYPGLNVKLPCDKRRVTALIFKSGKIILTGAKAVWELEHAFDSVTDILERTLSRP